MSICAVYNKCAPGLSLTGRALVASAALAVLGACAGSGQRYVDAETGEYLQFIDDSHVKYVGHFNDREWLYEADRSSNGDIMEMKMRHPDVGTLSFKRNRDGCLAGAMWGSAKGKYRRFCPQ